MQRWFRAGLVVLALFAASAALAATVNVSQKNRKFAPDELQIAVGTTVHIVNDDNVTHHIYVDSPTMKFDSGEQPVGSTVDLVFDKQGTFTVLCAIHPTMHLKVAVQ
jgi:plastocyanin